MKQYEIICGPGGQHGLARMGQIGEGSGLDGKRRAWQKLEERHMLLQQEGD